MYLKVGRFGPYVQRGESGEKEKPQNASLTKGMRPEDVDLATAVKLLSLPRPLGQHPQTEEPVEAHNGRFGPYVKSARKPGRSRRGFHPWTSRWNRPWPCWPSPRPAAAARPRKEPLKVFEASPVTGKPVELLEGRYGPYVTDGQTNASLPKSMPPQELTLEAALDLLKARAEKGPSPKSTRCARRARRRQKAPAAANGAGKTVAKRKATAKKAAPKRSKKKG